MYSTQPNRLVCQVLDEMRTCVAILNFSYLNSLIEEAQTLANRMEAALEDLHDIERMRRYKRELKLEIRELKNQKDLIEFTLEPEEDEGED